MSFSYSTGLPGDPLEQFTNRLERLEKSKATSDPSTWAKDAQKAFTFAIKDSNGQVASNEWQHQITRWQNLTLDRLGDFDHVDLSASLYNFAKISTLPSNEWLQKWHAASNEKLQSFKEQGLSNSLYAHALLGITPPQDWLQKWHAASNEKLASFESQHLSNSLYALAVAHILGSDVREIAKALKTELESRIEKQDNFLHSFGAHQFYLASKVFGWQTPPELVDKARNHSQSHGSSSIEKRVASALETIKLELANGSVKITSIDRNAIHPTTLSPVDFKISLEQNGTKNFIYLEVDGHYHFVKNPEGGTHLEGRTLIRNHLMQAYAKETQSGFAVINQLPKNASDKEVLGATVSAIKSAFARPAVSTSPTPDTKANGAVRVGGIVAAPEPLARRQT